MINKIWFFFIVSGIIFAILTGNTEIINKTIFDSSKASLDMTLQIFPVIALWLGVMKIASESGLLNKLAKFISPVLTKIFPEIPANHESFSLISSNIIANMFGLGNAATPLGLKAMQSLQELNKEKDTASNSMITFLVLNTSGLTIIPTTIISLRLLHGSFNPTDIVLSAIIATTISTIAGLMMDRILRRKNV